MGRSKKMLLKKMKTWLVVEVKDIMVIIMCRENV
jgi:hypothetical protein